MENTNQLPKIEKEMWCENCDGIFITDDYLNCNKCQLCTTEPADLCRVDSMAFIYAYKRKHPESLELKE